MTKPPAKPLEKTSPEIRSGADAPSRGEVPFWRSGVLVGLAVVMLIAEWLNPSVAVPQQAGVVMALPSVVKLSLPDRPEVTFYGTKASISDGELGTLPADTELLRKKYDDFSGHESILCTILLSGAMQNSIHRAEICLPAQGWTVIGQENLPVSLASGHPLVVRRLTLQRDIISNQNQHHTVRAYFMYWFVGEKTTTASHWTRVFIGGWDRVLHNRAHRWAYVMVMSPITDSLRPDGLDAAQTQKMLTDFIAKAAPVFQKSEMPDGGAR